MYFKRLELVGFKSFCNKTTLQFEPGVTAIVGPNGCGKSNIFDSIRWVLGEQSVKSLRGSDMQDVIFNGTDKKEPLSMAEVSVTFDNKTRFFPIDHDEVMISRRLFRSGESEYLLNKTQVRLKDVSDLLLGTGIGAESYSLVPQGRIDMILSSRPEDRRLVFDEAAGITKYKSQKREAMRKLEETEQNLLRVNDIITEVKRQIGSLERQANKARRYKDLFEELKNKEVRLAVLQKADFLRDRDETAAELNKLQEKEGEVLGAIQEQEVKIADQKQEARALEDAINNIKNQILNLDNGISRNREHINISHDRINELEAGKKRIDEQIGQTEARINVDKEKLDAVKEEYNGIQKEIEAKGALLMEKEDELNDLAAAIKLSLDNIAAAKKNLLELAARVSVAKNEVADFTAKEQVYLARQKRLEVEKAKVNEEKANAELALSSISQELSGLEGRFAELGLKINAAKEELGQENISLEQINACIADLEKQRLAMQSQKEFLEELKSKYDDIGESMNALLYLDKMPAEKNSGILIKVKEYLELADGDGGAAGHANVKISGEAKPMDLDTQKIGERIAQVDIKIASLKDNKAHKQTHIAEIKNNIGALEGNLRSEEMVLVNKRAQQQTAEDEVNKIKSEEEVIAIELSDVMSALSGLQQELNSRKDSLVALENEERNAEELISGEQSRIDSNNHLKEGVIVAITQARAELEALNKRVNSDQATIAILEDAFRQDTEALLSLKEQKEAASVKEASLQAQIKDLEEAILKSGEEIEMQKTVLKDTEARFVAVLDGTSDITLKIEADKKEIDNIKSRAYELQMRSKEAEYKYGAVKERILQGYKVDLDSVSDVVCEGDEGSLSAEIQGMKEKLDSYGTVNLVAIEEYDELKKRYDFLTQQQTDLLNAKQSLHDAILKLNKTTKHMFLETFQKVAAEFRNYFRLLFNGGDAQVFLVDEQDPLECGIEIICRPPGKKLQNVLLLSGGEKSMAAIALIFAIFKIKPAPFCVLDEIDAALDEANVDRFGRMLQEFTNGSQFIVITHNKKTIANADVMYGITMEESGVSKIISVKFSQGKPSVEPEGLAVAEPA
ncbi:MAG: AAA family ATPase [Candidatus Omnitrophota bacterium]